MKIWCIEDDININNLVVYALESSGYEVKGFVDYSEFHRAMKQEKPDLIILDVMLPDMDGMEILKQLRRNLATHTIPVIMLTAKTAEIDKVRALDMGLMTMCQSHSALWSLSAVYVQFCVAQRQNSRKKLSPVAMLLLCRHGTV